jgi:cytochrome P450
MALMDINAALLSAFFIGLLLVLVYCSRWRRYFELGMKLPGPPALPIVGNGLLFTSNDPCKIFQQFRNLVRTYGPIARLWFGPVLVVLLTDADGIERVVNHDKLCTRGYLVRKSAKPFFRNGVFSTDGDEWRRRRKIINAAFHTKILKTFVETFAKNSDILANNLKALADGVTAHDISPYIGRCTLDIIVQISCRVEINTLTGNDHSTFNNMKTIFDGTVMKFLKPWLYIDWIFKATELGKKYYKAMECEHGKIINGIGRMKRMRQNTDSSDLNDEQRSLMDTVIQQGDINNEETVGEIATIISAGADASSIANGYVLALLGDNQHIQARVMQEQQDIFGDDILRPVRSDDLPRMVYLEQVGNCCYPIPHLVG